MARPKGEAKPINWELLDALIVWASQEYCAEKLNMSVSSLERKLKAATGLIFSEYKKKRQEPMRINLLKKQYDVAMAGNVSMLIWLGKQHLGQKENNTDLPDGTKIQISYGVKNADQKPAAS